MKTLVVVSLLILPLWWIFLVLWQPGFVHVVGTLSYRMFPLSITSDTARLARERALDYTTFGSNQTEDIYFTSDEVMHLRDVSNIYKPISFGINSLAIGAWTILLLAAFKKYQIRDGIKKAAKVIAILTGLTSITLLFFSFFFEQFHRLLFPQGNWSFPADSMLITIFPELFWQLLLGSIVSMLFLFTAFYWVLGNRK